MKDVGARLLILAAPLTPLAVVSGSWRVIGWALILVGVGIISVALIEQGRVKHEV